MNTDAFDEVPGKAALQQELRLLPFLASPPIPRLYSGPIDLAEVRQVAAILKEIRAGIRQSERPTLILLMRPRNRCLEVGLEVEDWTLAAAINQLCVIALIDQIQHHGARAEIDRKSTRLNSSH